ncbi:MAG: extracellular solute-binding protein [Actinobacteria bacterium]|nr:extracellular solute-binding protein [Actinomycetota bacterium]
MRNVLKKTNPSVLLTRPAIILLVSFLMISSVSCGIFKSNKGNLNNTNITAATTADTLKDNAGQPKSIEITIWDSISPKERAALTDSIGKFLTLNTTIKIQSRHFISEEELIDQFEASSLAGSGPEILLSSFDAAQKLASANVVKNVEDALNFNELIDGLVEISTFGSKKFIIPFRATDFLMLFYNKNLTGSVPADFDSLIEYCKKVNKPKENAYGFLLNSREPEWIIPLIGSYQDWIVDYNTGSINLDTQSVQKMLEFLVKIYNKDKIMPYDIAYEEINNSFKEGKTQMVINGIWAIDEYNQAGINFGVSKIPILPEGFRNPTPLINGTGFMINVNCYNEKLLAANTLISYMMSPEVQGEWTISTQTFPVLKKMSENDVIKNNPVFLAAFEQAKLCRGKPAGKILRVISDAIRINLENVIRGSIAPKDAVIKMQEDVVKLMSGSAVTENTNEGSLVETGSADTTQ